MNVLTIRTGCRLHFGLLTVGHREGRQYGGVGVMLDSPGYSLRFVRAEQDEVIAPPAIAARIAEFTQRWRKSMPRTSVPTRITVTDAIPEHVGLGAGTQLAMAVATGLNMVEGSQPVPHAVRGEYVNRGARSSVGIHGFEFGGLLVDGGKATPRLPAPLVALRGVHPNWRWVLVRPTAEEGLSGGLEKEAFASLPPMPRELTAELCRLLILGMLPAVADYELFAQGLEQYGRLVGEYFRPAQGGIFASRPMESLVDELRRQGVVGMAQSSWGPTVAFVTRDEDEARELVGKIEALAEPGAFLIQISRTMPTGAECTWSEASP